MDDVWCEVVNPLKDFSDSTDLSNGLSQPWTSEGEQTYGAIQLAAVRIDHVVG